MICAGGHDVHFAGQLGHPEAVEHVVAFQVQADGPVNGDAELVGGGYPLPAAGVRIFELEIPLVARDDDVEHLGAVLWGFVQLEEGEHRPDSQPQDHYRGDDGPNDFQRGVTVIWGGRSCPGRRPVAYQSVKEGSLHQHEDRYHGPEQHLKQQELFFGDRPHGLPSGLLSLAAGHGKQ